MPPKKSSSFCVMRIKGLARLQHPKSYVDQLSHRRSYYNHRAFASLAQSFTKI
jgi:hypothetical protein